MAHPSRSLSMTPRHCPFPASLGMAGLAAFAGLTGCGASRTAAVASPDSSSPAARDSFAGSPPTTVTDSVAGAGPGAVGPTDAPDGAGLPLRRIGQWSHTGIGEPRRVVLRDANAWTAFWAELGPAAGARPEIDFTRNLIIAVAAGQRRSGGYGIAVDRVSRSGGELTIETVETTPSPNCLTTQALTQPVDVVVVPAAGVRSWSFVERKEVAGC